MGEAVAGGGAGGEGAAGGATGQGGAGAAGSQGAGAADWTASVAPEYRDFVTSKGYKSIDDALKSAMLTEKMKGYSHDQVVRKVDWSKPDSVAEWRKSIGVPEALDAYQSHEVKLPNGVLDPSYITKISHKLGLPQEQHAMLLDATGELVTELFQGEQTRFEQEQAAKFDAYKSELGPQFPVVEQQAKTAEAAFKVTAEEREALDISMGKDGALRFLSRIGQGIGEQRPGEGEGGGNTGGFNAMSGEAAREQQKALFKDKAWAARYYSGDRAARAEMDALNKAIVRDLEKQGRASG